MQDFNEYLKVRKDLYLFLGKCFYLEPNAKHLEEMKKRLPVFRSVSDMTGSLILKTGCDEAEAFLDSVKNGAGDELINSLACEFAFLFLSVHGAIGEPSVALTESVWLSRRRISMQEPRDAVMEFYNKYGMGVSEDFSEPEDHLSAETGFLAAMSGATYEAVSQNGEKDPEELLNAQIKFLNEHIGRFVGKIATELDKKAKSLYYKGIGRLAWGFVESDTLFLAAFLDKKDGEGGLADER